MRINAQFKSGLSVFGKFYFVRTTFLKTKAKTNGQDWVIITIALTFKQQQVGQLAQS
jgi:hypothetical protein